ncbi:MAG: histidine kinase [Acidobacteria bacterium]|nr:histidine kinase [Acidobacteriota bacterium]
MTTHEAPPRAPSAAGAAPLDYAEVRADWRLARAALAGVLVCVAVAALVMEIPGGAAKVVAAALVLAHALIDRRAGPLRSLLPAALALSATAGLAEDYAGPLAALTGYILTASALTLPLRRVFLPAAALAAGAALRLTVLAPAPWEETGPAGHLANVETAACLLLVGLMAFTAARAIRTARQEQAEAIESERRAATMKNEFVSMVSHELRTPLTNISGFAMALRDSWRTLDPAEVDEFLSVICSESEHLRRLVDDVLVVPRLEVDRLLIEPADFQLRPAAFRIADLVFPPGGTKSASVTVGGNVVVHADPNRVEQVLRNLLENAAKHGGSQISVDAAARGDEWLVVVADDGPGVDEAHRERVFAPFEQAEPSASPGNGLGLGLTVSRVLVEAMGGRIWYESGFPTGARFCFTLPTARATTAVPAAS